MIVKKSGRLINYLTGLIFTAFLISGCNQSQKGEQVTVEINRFEKDLFRISVYNLRDSIDFLHEKYPAFFPLFVGEILEINDTSPAVIADGVVSFVTDFTIYRVSKHIKEVFSSLDNYESGLSQAFTSYKLNFPDKDVPKVLSCITGFNQSMITSDSLLAIGLDKYLGAEDEFYKLLYPPVPVYLRSAMIPERIVPDAMMAWTLTEFPYHDDKNNLLSQIIFHGRAYYMVNELIPGVNDTLLWGFSRPQMNFCLKNEKPMWEYLIEHKKLFTTDPFTISQFINEAPFTKDFSRESPGRVAIWLGYRIVSSFMAKNRDVTLNELMAKTDYQEILNLSKYNP